MSIDEQTEELEPNYEISIATLALLLFLVSSLYNSVMRLRLSDSVAPICIGCFLYRAIHFFSVVLDVTLESGLQCRGVPLIDHLHLLIRHQLLKLVSD